MTHPLSLYIHFPFCKSFCFYCAFPRGLYSQSQVELYLNLLTQEIKIIPKTWKTPPLKTIFIGGGTPSLMSISNFKRLFNIIKQNFDTKNIEEFSIELNPEDVNEDLIRFLSDHGINRFSVGIQTFKNPEKLGRRHSKQKSEEILELFQKLKLNFNADLIFGLPNTTLFDVEKDILHLLEYNPSHISVYGLEIDNNSYFSKHPPSNLPDENKWIEMYYLSKELLEQYGFIHYEISNYSKPGKECQHNMGYWTGRNYLGIGSGAASRYEKFRWYSPYPLSKYKNKLSKIKNIQDFADDFEILNKQEKIKEQIFTGLRLSQGIKLPQQIFNKMETDLKSLQQQNLLTIRQKHILLTKKSLILSNYVINKIIESFDKIQL